MQKTKYQMCVIFTLMLVFLILLGSIPACSSNHELWDHASIKFNGSYDRSHPSQSPLTDSEVEWDRVFDRNSYYGHSICESSDGGYVVTGRINQDIALFKTNTNGKDEWNTSFDSGLNDNGNCIRKTTDGGYVITGYVDSYQDMMTYSRVGLLRYNEQGNLLWNKSYKFGRESIGWSVLQTSDQGFIVVGFTSKKNDDVLLIKTDEVGNEQWNRTYGGSKEDYGLAIDHSDDGGYIILGRTESFSNDSFIWLIRIDGNGNELWNRTIPGSQDIWGSSFSHTADGGQILVGYYFYSSSWSTDAWLMKIDADGVEEWNQTYGGNLSDTGQSVQQMPDNGYVFTGYTGSLHQYDPYTFWIVRTDAYGVELWNRSIPSNRSAFGSDIHLTSDGMLIVAGSFDSNIWMLKLADEPPQTKGMNLLIGTITNLETEGTFITFQANNIWYVQLLPPKINHYVGYEYITLSQHYKGMVRARFIIGFFNLPV
jgi:hypothetical protein